MQVTLAWLDAEIPPPHDAGVFGVDSQLVRAPVEYWISWYFSPIFLRACGPYVFRGSRMSPEHKGTSELVHKGRLLRFLSPNSLPSGLRLGQVMCFLGAPRPWTASLSWPLVTCDQSGACNPPSGTSGAGGQTSCYGERELDEACPGVLRLIDPISC